MDYMYDLANQAVPELVVQVTNGNGNGWTDIMRMIRNYLIAPGLLIVIGWVMTILKSYGQRITNSVVSQNELAELRQQRELRLTALAELNSLVELAVCSTMPLAIQLKENETHKLTENSIRELKGTVKQLVYDTVSGTYLPGDKTHILGDRHQLDALIAGLTEKHVIQQKSLIYEKKV